MSLESINDGFFSEKTDVVGEPFYNNQVRYTIFQWSYGVICWEVFLLGRMLKPKKSCRTSGYWRKTEPRSSVCSHEM